MEFLNEFWVTILPAIMSFLGGTIGGAIISGFVKGGVSKLVGSINVQKIADNATNKGLDKIKKVSFEHSIQPVVESELKKVNEASTELVKQELIEVKEGYANVIVILEKFAAYFDGSIAVTDEKKAELHKAIKDAKLPETVFSSTLVNETSKEVVGVIETERKETSNENIER